MIKPTNKTVQMYTCIALDYHIYNFLHTVNAETYEA